MNKFTTEFKLFNSGKIKKMSYKIETDEVYELGCISNYFTFYWCLNIYNITINDIIVLGNNHY